MELKRNLKKHRRRFHWSLLRTTTPRGSWSSRAWGSWASAFGVPQETALKWLAPPRVAAAASRGGIGVGAVIFTPSSGEINYLGVGGQHSGCGAAAALVRFAEEAMQVADLFIVPRDGAARRFWWRAGYTASGSSSTVTGRMVKKGAPRPSRGVPFGGPPSRHPEKGAGCSGQLRLVPRRYRRFSSSDEHPPPPGLVRQGDSAFIIICIMCSFFPGSFGVVFSQLCNVFCPLRLQAL